MLAVFVLAGCAAKVAPPPPKAPEWPSLPLASVPNFMRGTLLERVRFTNLDPLSVYAYSLVVNLHDTGDCTAPTWIRDYITKQLVIHGFGSVGMQTYEKVTPEEILDDKRVAIVTVEGRMPVGIREGQRFDAIVRALPRSHTTSLAHGELYETELSLHGLQDPTALGANPLAVITGGQVFLNPTFALQEGASNAPGQRASQLAGTILDGAISKIDRPINLELRQPQVSTARRIEELIQERWHGSSQYQPDGDNSRIVALAQNEGLVQIFMPPEYHGDWQHFVGVVSHLYLDNSPEFTVAKAKELVALSRKPGAPLADISLCWESMGESALPIFQPLISDPDPSVAFAAARAAAFVGDGAAREALLQTAMDSSSNYQLDAVRALGELPVGPETIHMIRSLLDSDKAEVRIEAYKILSDAGDSAIFTVKVGGGFLLDIVESAGPPMVYASTSGVPRLAIFGTNLSLQTPLTFTAMDTRLSLSSSDGTDKLTLFYRDPNSRTPKDSLVENDLARILARLGGEATETEDAFNFSFNDVVAIAQQLIDSQQVYATTLDGRKLACIFELEHAPMEADPWIRLPRDMEAGRPQGSYQETVQPTPGQMPPVGSQPMAPGQPMAQPTAPVGAADPRFGGP
jgi:hypothetical protein